MHPFHLLRLLLGLCVPALILQAAEPASVQGRSIKLVDTIPLPKVKGLIDNIVYDQNSRRLLVAALDNNSIEVIETNTGKQVYSLTNLHGPQGICFSRELGRFAVTNRADSSIVLFDARTMDSIASIPLKGITPIVRYDNKSKLFWVACADVPGYLGLISADDAAFLASVKLDSAPGAFQMETGGPLLFVSLPDANQIAVVNRYKNTVTGKWSLKTGSNLTSMALDEIGHRLFVAGGNPARLQVLNSRTGGLVTAIDLKGKADDMFYDPALHKLVIIGSEGTITIVAVDNGDACRIVDSIDAPSGTHAACFFAQSHRLYVAVSQSATQQAEIRVYSLPIGAGM